MRDWRKDLYRHYMQEKVVPQILGWDVFFYGWDLMSEALHIADTLLNGVDKLSSERKIHTTAHVMMNRYMRNNYPKWYRRKLRVLRTIEKAIIFMKVD